MSAPDIGPLRDYANLPIWVAWQAEKPKNRAKATKPPYNPCSEGKARSDRPSTWGTLAQAVQRASTLPKPFGLGGVGVMFAPLGDGTHLGGIDLDTCRDPTTGTIAPWAQQIIDHFDSYTEVSPSDTGVKILIRCTPAEVKEHDLRNQKFTRGKGDHPPAIEVYVGNGYFTVTGQSVNGIDLLRVVPAADLQWLVETAGPAFAGEARETTDRDKAKREHNGRSLTIEDLAAAYEVMRNDDLSGDEWIARGTALKGQPGDDEAKFAIFDAFSRKSADKYHEAYTRERWSKFKPNGKLTAGSIIHWARESAPDWKPPSWHKPEIRYDSTDPKRMAREGEAVLLANGAAVYQQVGKVVRVVTLGEPTKVRAVQRPAGAVVLHTASPVWLTGEFMEAAQWVRLKENKKTGEWEWKPDVLPRSVAETYLEMVGEWRLPELIGTVETPTLFKSGDVYELLQEPGYDAVSGLYYVPGTAFPPITERPSRHDAFAALGKLLGLLKEFPFVPDDAGDDWMPGDSPGQVPSAARSVFLSAVLTGLIRRHMRAAPMHIFDSNSAGTGKSYLASIVATILTGREAGAVPWVRNEEEMRKRIAAVLLAGDPVFRFDNIEQPLGGPALNILLSEAVYRDRLLGKSSMIEALTNCLVLATGNNVEVEADTTRRSVRCRMDARHERPQERQFQADPLREATQRRGELVVAGLVILLAYLHEDCPGLDTIKHIGGYEDWSLVRGALMWLGQPDPADTMQAIGTDDPVRDEIAQMMFAWDALYEGRGAVKLTEVISDAQRGGDKYTNNDPKLSNLFDACDQALKGNKLNAHRLGHWFKKRDGKIVGGRRFVRSGDDKHGRKIALVAVGKAAHEAADLIDEAEQWET